MPRRPRSLSTSDGPLAAFALELRALRDSCGPTAPRPDDISLKEGIHRTTIYAALAGKRVPSRDVLAAMVKHWNGDQAEWSAKRSALENTLGTVRQIQEHQRRSREPAGRAADEITWDDLEQVGATPDEFSTRSQLHAKWRDEELALFTADLRQLIASKNLSLREIEKQSRSAEDHRSWLGRSTLADALRGKHLLSWEKLAVLLKILGDEEHLREWQDRWVRLRNL